MDIDLNSLLFLGLGLIAIVLILWFLKSRIKNFDVNLGKGLFKFKGETHQQNTIEHSEEKDIAHKVLMWIQEKLFKVKGNYVLTESTNENAKTAAQLYSKLTGDIIATCFFETPDYGNDDYANTISPGANFTRITLQELCDEEAEKKLQEKLSEFECNARLIVIPNSVNITKIGGVFCKLPDKSYIAFMALNDVGSKKINHGLTFSCEIAERLYNYYNSFKN